MCRFAPLRSDSQPDGRWFLLCGGALVAVSGGLRLPGGCRRLGVCGLVVCLHLPVRAGRGFLNSWGVLFRAAGGTTTGTGTPQRREITFSATVLVRAGFAPRRVRGLWSLASVTPERRRVTPG